MLKASSYSTYPLPLPPSTRQNYEQSRAWLPLVTAWMWDRRRLPRAPPPPSWPRTWQPLNFQLITWPRKLISSQLNGPLPRWRGVKRPKAALRSTGPACLADDWGYCGTFVTEPLGGFEQEQEHAKRSSLPRASRSCC